MKVQIDVDGDLWREAKAEAAMQGVKLKRFVEGVLRNSLPYSKVSKIPVRGAELAGNHGPEPARRTDGATPSTGSKTPPTPIPVPAKAYVDEEVKMAKCKRCYESFPVADMVTEPKTGKLFCADCVELMKGGQA